MEKEELIKLIENLEFEYVDSFKLNYRKRKPESYNIGNNNLQTLTYGEDILEGVQNEMTYINQRIDKIGEDVFRLINKEEKLTSN